MRIFVTGATGFIGSAVVPELLGAGHAVVGLARSDRSAAALAAVGAEARRGSLVDLDTLRAAAAEADGIIHLAFNHDFRDAGDFDRAVETEARAIAAFGDALAGSGKPLIFTSGTPPLPGRVATERDDFLPEETTANRGANALAALALTERGIRTVVVRMPRSVHGDGDVHGFVPMVIGAAREHGVAAIPGDGANRWPAVHVLDAARLFRLAVEKAPAGAILHAVGDEGVPTGDIAAAIGRHLGVPVGTLPDEAFGFLATIFAIDQPASSALTRALVGWEPTHPGLIDDIEQGHYFRRDSVAAAR